MTEGTEKYDANNTITKARTIQNGNISTKQEDFKGNSIEQIGDTTIIKLNHPEIESVVFNSKTGYITVTRITEDKSSRTTTFHNKQKIREIEEKILKTGACHETHTGICGHEFTNKTTTKIFDENNEVASIIEIIDKNFTNVESCTITDKNGQTETLPPNMVDGKIKYSKQVGRGDCYLLAALNALNESEAGRKIIKDAIGVHTATGNENITDIGLGDKNVKKGDKIYTVSLYGAKEVELAASRLVIPPNKITLKPVYSFTESQIQEALKKGNYSKGDIDVVLVELAYEAYRKDADNIMGAIPMADRSRKSHLGSLDSNFKIRGIYHSDDKTDALSGGCCEDALFLLTGKESVLLDFPGRADASIIMDGNMVIHNSVMLFPYRLNQPKESEKNKELLKLLEEDCKDGKLDDYAITLGIGVTSDTGRSGHAIAVTKIQNGIVYAKNSHNPNFEIQFSLSELERSNGELSILPLTQKGNDSLKKFKQENLFRCSF